MAPFYRCDERRSTRIAVARECDGCRQSSCDVNREARSREHADPCCRANVSGDLVAEPTGLVLEALAQPEHARGIVADAAQHFFKPLKMSRSSWREDYARLVPGRAQAYAPDIANGWRLDTWLIAEGMPSPAPGSNEKLAL